MMPIAPLMIEHRLIERVIALLEEALREKDRMLKEGLAFDSDLLHGEWEDLVASLEGGSGSGEKTAPGE